MAPRAALVTLVVIALTARARGDAPDDLGAARAALGRLDYGEALAAVDRAWRHGGSAAERVRELCALAGRAAASMGDGTAARLWFARMIYLDPGAALPAGTSSKLVRSFEEARAQLAGATLAGTAIRRGDSIEVALAPDPLALVAAARVGGRTRPIARPALTRLPWDGEARAVELVDARDNVLGTVEITEDAPPITPAHIVTTRIARRPWYVRWQPWAGVAGTSAFAGGVALVVAYRADRRLDELAASGASATDAGVTAQLARLERAQWAARIGLGAAAVAGAIAVWRGVDERAPRSELALVPVAGGAAVVWSARR
jgi:hypothetical protein